VPEQLVSVAYLELTGECVMCRDAHVGEHLQAIRAGLTQWWCNEWLKWL